MALLLPAHSDDADGNTARDSFGHVGGVPLEELLPSVSGAGAGLLLARAWLVLHLQRRREPGT